MKSFLGTVAPLGIALLVPAASCAASTIFLSGVSTMTTRLFGMEPILTASLSLLTRIPEPASMAFLSMVLFSLAGIVRVGSRGRVPAQGSVSGELAPNSPESAAPKSDSIPAGTHVEVS